MLEGITGYIKVFIAIFVLVNPLEGIPFYLNNTRGLADEDKRKIIKKTSTSVFFILIFSFFLGRYVLTLFGISTGAFTLAGGIIIFLISLSMVLGQSSKDSSQVTDDGTNPRDSFAIVPLAIPLLAGPGPISSMILYGGSVTNFEQLIVIPFIAAAVSFAVYLSFKAASPLEMKLKKTGVDVLTKVSGILISAIAVEMIHKGLLQLFPVLGN
ncbi:MAG: MarC family protein [Ignavibacteria bacterium]|nr:MarC family protein [Ignavibacteria bacterium]